MTKINIFCGEIEGQAKDKTIKFMHKTGQNAKNIADGISKSHPIIYGWLASKKSITLGTWDMVNNYIDNYKH